MKPSFKIACLLFVFVLCYSSAIAHQIKIDTTDISTAITASGNPSIPAGGSGVYDLSEGSHVLYSTPGGFVASIYVQADGTLNYDPAYDGTVLTGAGSSTVTIKGHPITIDGTQVITDLYEPSLRAISSTQPDGTATYKLPANIERRVGVDYYSIFSSCGGRIARFWVVADGSVSYEAQYNGIITGEGNPSITVLGYEITIDASEVDTELYEYGLGTTIGSAKPGETFTYKLPANPEHGPWGPYQLLSQPGGRLAFFQIEADGTVSFEPGYDGLATGAGTSTISVPGYPITIDASEVDTELYEYGLGTTIGSAKPGETFTYKLPANPEHGPWGPYQLLSQPGGRLAFFQIEADGTVSFEPGYDGLATGAGTSTISVPGYPITIDASEVDTELYEYGLGTTIGSAKPGETFTYKLPANPEHGPWGPYQLLSQPGGRLAFFQIEADGTVSFEPGYDGLATGAGTSTISVPGYPITIDASEVDTELYEYGLGTTIGSAKPGETFTYKLPANPEHGPWGPYQLLSQPGGRLAFFQIEADGTVSYDVVYEGVVSGAGTQKLTGIPYLVTIDATDVDPGDSIFVYYIDPHVIGGTTGDLRLPANPDHGSWGPYNLRSRLLFWLPDATFKINNGGTCSIDEVVYEYGTVRLYCSVYNPDVEPPITSNVEASPNPVEINTDVTLSAVIDDSETGGSNISLAEYNIDDSDWIAIDGAYDSPTEQISVVVPADTFLVPQVHEICVRGVDEAGNIGLKECTLLAVYDPEGGFVTGGGWIISEQGAYKTDLTLEGKANFGFVSKYKKGASIPTGNTEFQFKTGDLNFKSVSYEWLVVTGDKTAKYKGVGSINSAGNYKFMIWAKDFEPDTFRIKIWEEDEFENETVVYDNGFDQEIAGGNIKVHEGNY